MALVGFLVALAAGSAVAVVVRSAGGWETGLAWEHTLLSSVHRTALHPILDWVLLVVPWFGTNYTLLPAIMVAVTLLARRGRWDLAWRLFVVLLGSWALNIMLKAAFVRPRPELWEKRGQFALASYPSGHAIAAVSVILTVALILSRERGERWPIVAGLLMLAISLYSRLYLGVHWPTDVLGGVAMGFVWLIATTLAFPRRGGDSGAT